MKAGCFIDMQELKDYEEAKITPYQQLISKLMYLLYNIRPDISFIVGQLIKYNADPQIRHIKAAKKVVRYLKSIMHIGLIYDGHLKDEGETQAQITPFPFGLIRY